LNHHFCRRRRGQAVVEFALVFPVFLLFFLAALEFGRYFLDAHMLTTAARRGARMGVLPGKVESDVTSAVDTFLQNVGMDPGAWATAIAVKDSSGQDRAGGLANAVEGDRVYVTVTYDFHITTGGLLPFFPDTKQIIGKYAFRHE